MHLTKYVQHDVWSDSHDSISICSDLSDATTLTSLSASDVGCDDDDDDDAVSVTDKLIVSRNVEPVEAVEATKAHRNLCHDKLSALLNSTQNIYQNVRINKSRKVHLGNITYIKGPVHVKLEAEIEEPIMSLSLDNQKHIKFRCRCKTRDVLLEYVGKLAALKKH